MIRLIPLFILLFFVKIIKDVLCFFRIDKLFQRKMYNFKIIPPSNVKNLYNHYTQKDLTLHSHCDAGIFNGIAYYSTGLEEYWTNTFYSFDNEGKPYRTPGHNCYPHHSRSTSSRDDLTGKYLAFLKAIQKKKNIKFLLLKHVRYLWKNNLIFGEGEKSAIKFTPNMAYLLRIVMEEANVKIPFWLKVYGCVHEVFLPFSYLIARKIPSGYQRHLKALHLLIILDIKGNYYQFGKYAHELYKGNENMCNALLGFLMAKTMYKFYNEFFYDSVKIFILELFKYKHVNSHNSNYNNYLWMNRYSEDKTNKDYYNYHPNKNEPIKEVNVLDRVFIYYLLYLKDWSKK